LLRDDNNSLSRGERELIGTYVSYLNDCFFCQNVHGALAGHYLGCDINQIDVIKEDFMASAELTDGHAPHPISCRGKGAPADRHRSAGLAVRVSSCQSRYPVAFATASSARLSGTTPLARTSNLAASFGRSRVAN
ncbi:MAG: hypothetical protein EON58_16755, partial [Alphaproteobacteria bacterium]